MLFLQCSFSDNKYARLAQGWHKASRKLTQVQNQTSTSLVLGPIVLAVGLSNSWYGYFLGGVGSLSTTLNGCGVATLDFGQCCGCKGIFTQVNLNGNEIARTDQLTLTITINFCDGDILELKHEVDGYIRFNSFTVLSCSQTQQHILLAEKTFEKNSLKKIIHINPMNIIN